MKLKALSDLKDNIAEKRVLVRVDFNIQTDKKNRILPGQLFRLQRSVATIKWLLKRHTKVIILSDRGRPNGKVVDNLSNKHLSYEFSNMLSLPVKFVPSVIEKEAHKAIKDMKSGEVLFLENLRFYKGEDENDSKFAKELAALGDIFVNDAFAKSHRTMASIVSLPKLLPSYAGLLLEEEIKELSQVIKDPDKPLVVVIGGAKCQTKIPLIEKFLPFADAILVGGILANTLLKSAHFDIGDSIYEEDFVDIGKTLVKNKKIILPKDVVCDDINTEDVEAEIKSLDEIKQSDRIIDVGAQTAIEYSNYIRTAKTVLWNGPLGWIEKRQGSHASEAMADFLAAMSHSKKIKSVIGGGETLSVVDRIGVLDDITFVSTGGGAMLDFLVNKSLPGIEPYIKK